jgi:hypothetical protein
VLQLDSSFRSNAVVHLNAVSHYPQNIRRNPDHYSWVAKLGPEAVRKVCPADDHDTMAALGSLTYMECAGGNHC